MKINCPECECSIPADQINMSTDLAFCPTCSDAFKVSEVFGQATVGAEVLGDPPKGTWFRQESANRAVVGASTRSPIAFFLVPFMCVWSGGSLGGIYGSQIQSGEFDLAASLFGIPFVLGSVLFWSVAIMAIWGKVEVTVGNASSVFVGVGSAGWTRKFDWAAVRTIREDASSVRFPGGHQGALLLEGKMRLKFGSGLNTQRRYFVMNALNHLITSRR